MERISYFPPHLRKTETVSEFLPSGKLRTRIKWTCTCRIAKKSVKTVLNEQDQEIRRYYTFCDEWGCHFATFKKAIGNALNIGFDYYLEGEIAVSKGNVYLNIMAASFPDGTSVLLSNETSNQNHEEERRETFNTYIIEE